MVDWDRVKELREKGWEWDRIADDAKVGFHPDAAMTHPGRALRTLYHHHRSREARRGPPVEKKISKRAADELEQRWTLKRYGFLLTPVFGLWFLFAYLVPSPIGLVLPAIPWLALAFAVVAFLLVFALWRQSGARWNKVLRGTVISGVVLGLVFSALIAVGGVAFFGCPFLPVTTTSQSAGWTSVGVSSWQQNGEPVVYFYGATWCPYCSASSWAIWAALSNYEPGHKSNPSSTSLVPGAQTGSSSPSDVYPNTPEMVLAYIQTTSPTVAFQVSEDTSGVDGQFPATSGCVQQAYVTAYSGNSIPFVAVNGQYVHGGSSLINPSDLSPGGQPMSPSTVALQVASENTLTGSAWLVVQGQAWWMMAYIAKASGEPVSTLASQYGWSTATASAVSADVAAIH